jgi:hypothetical protein
MGLHNAVLLVLACRSAAAAAAAAAATATATATAASATVQQAARTHLVVPCFNEELRLPSEAFVTYADAHPHTHFLFVDDGSTDGTARMLRELRASRPASMALLELPRNVGKAEATRYGMLAALAALRQGNGGGGGGGGAGDEQQPAALSGRDSVGFWDGDLATPLEAVGEFAEVLARDSALKMVFGARVGLLGRRIQRHLDRHYLGRVFATLASALLGLRIYDTQCGAKIFRATADLGAVLAEPFPAASRWVFDVELIARFAALHRGEVTGEEIGWGTGDTDGVGAAAAAAAAAAVADETEGAAAGGGGGGGGGGPKRRRPRRLPLERVIYELPLREWRDIAGSKVNMAAKLGALSGLAHIWKAYYSPWKVWPGPATQHVLEAQRDGGTMPPEVQAQLPPGSELRHGALDEAAVARLVLRPGSGGDAGETAGGEL